MSPKLLRPFLIVEFLIALEVVFTFWSEVGGQYHLDLMHWAWKLGFSLGAATLIVAITADIARNEGAITKRALTLSSILLLTAIAAGVVTYYYHLSEPSDDDDDDDQPRVTKTVIRTDAPREPRSFGKLTDTPGRRVSF